MSYATVRVQYLSYLPVASANGEAEDVSDNYASISILYKILYKYRYCTLYIVYYRYCILYCIDIVQVYCGITGLCPAD